MMTKVTASGRFWNCPDSWTASLAPGHGCLPMPRGPLWFQGGSQQPLAALDAGLLGHQVGARAAGLARDRAMDRLAILERLRLVEQCAELVGADIELAL